jgi:small subunit ribosomal protein S2
MVEPTGQPPVSAPAPEPAPPASPEVPEVEVAEPTPPRELSLKALVETGCHFGHQTRRWDPRMKPYIYGDRNGIHIIDLDRSLVAFEEALDFLREVVAAGGKVLFVGTKRQAQGPIQLEALRAGQFFANNRWLGGMLTNFRTVKKSIERFKEGLDLLADEERISELSKKDRSRISRQVGKYRKSLDGIKEMTKLPDALFVIDVGKERIAVTEARRLGIPIVAIVDTNCSPEGIDYVVPGNDDAIRAVQLYCSLVAEACVEGQVLFNERVQSQEQPATEAAGQPAGPTTGRVVVEINQPPRRGARGGARSAGGRRDETPEKSEPQPTSE